jgi:hypothetical protein
MNLSMDPGVHYVTQSALFTSPLKGPLTDRRIAYYQRRGWYSGGHITPERRPRRSGRAQNKAILAKMLNQYT